MSGKPDQCASDKNFRLECVRRPYFTIGHSTRSVDELVALLREAVAMVVDVRTVPRSRTNPQFNADSLPDRLARCRIGYRHSGARWPARLAARARPSPKGFWENASFRNYADYAMTPEFRAGLARAARARRGACAIMCAEAVWWRCHRRIIADYLLSEGQEVRHIRAPATSSRRP